MSLVLLALIALAPAVRAQTERADLTRLEARLAQADSPLQGARQRLHDDAQRALLQKPLSVLDKKQGLVGADPRDYVSYAPYFWPNPATPTGLPFVRKDGQRNREQVAKGDEDNGGTIKRAITTLGLAYALEHDDAYVQKAATLLRTWFLDPRTGMNPNLDHGQAIPGGVTGRKEGIIEWRDLTGLLLACECLSSAPTWSADDTTALRAWLTRYEQWLTTSKIGLAEKNATNNHGCWYDVQAMALALYLGKTDRARQLAEEFKHARIDRQIQPDGRMPAELTRADSWGYSTFNLTAMLAMARYARRVGVDLWGYKSTDGRSIPGALAYLLPFAQGKAAWPHENDPSHTVEPARLVSALLHAVALAPEAGYEEQARRLAGATWTTLRERLLLP